MGNIEQIKTEIDEIQNEFKKLAGNIHLSEKEKQKTVETLNTRCQKIKEEIEQEIASLWEKTDAKAQEKREKAEMLLESLDKTSKLYQWILNVTEQANDSNQQKWDQILATSADSNSKESFFGKVFNKIWSIASSIWDFIKTKIWSFWGKRNHQSLNWYMVDKSEFSKGRYPFKGIPPYQWISAYRVDNVKLEPHIWFSQLSLEESRWSTTLKVKNENKRYTNTNAAWYKKNNPCNVSPFKGDIGRVTSSKVADWQDHSQYETMEDGLASFMRLMRTERYNNKSIQGRNCSGMQWIYKPDEDKSLQALRIIWITHVSEALNVSPFIGLNTDDPETMMAFTQAVAIRESGCHFDKDTLERAYYKAFPEEALSLAA